MSDIISDDDFVRLFQKSFGLKVDGYAGQATTAKLFELAPPSVTPADAADVPDSYWPMLAQIESGNNAFAKAPTSTGSGLYQFIKATWEGEGGQWGPDPAKPFGGLTPTPAEQTARAKTFTAKNVTYLKAHGVPINKASLYAAHFLGAFMAVKIINAGLNDRVDLIAGPAATRANRSILENKTLGDFLAWLHSKTGEWAR